MVHGVRTGRSGGGPPTSPENRRGGAQRCEWLNWCGASYSAAKVGKNRDPFSVSAVVLVVVAVVVVVVVKPVERRGATAKPKPLKKAQSR